MYIPHAGRSGKTIHIIRPGEYRVSAEDDMIGTLLGSCVSVCLFDAGQRVSGMNHFMLPGRIVKSDLFKDRSGRYGITAMNELIMGMEEAGASRRHITAKVFGGGHVMTTAFESSSLPLDNIRLARVMLELEDIPIEQMSVGGRDARKIVMESRTGKVFLKKVSREKIVQEIKDRDIEYLRQGAVVV
jgi:chemotaxis protein CheD